MSATYYLRIIQQQNKHRHYSMKILELSDIYQEVVSEKTLNDILFPNITDSYYINSTGKEKPKSNFIPQFVFFFYFWRGTLAFY